MNTLQIQYFIETAKTLNFSEAARALYVSQPAVSRQIAMLERELNVTLFHRSPHAIELTETGKKMYCFFLESHDKMAEILSQAHKNGINHIYIDVYEGRNTGTVSQILNSARAYMSRQYPKIEVFVNARPFSEIDRLLHSSDDRLIIAPLALFDKSDDVKTVMLKKDQIIILYSHALFPELPRRPKLEDFSTKALFTFDSLAASPAYQKNIHALLKMFRIKSKIREEHTLDTIVNNILYGNGYTITGIGEEKLLDLPCVEYFPLNAYSYLCAAYNEGSSTIIAELAENLGM